MPRPLHKLDLSWRRGNLAALMALCMAAAVALGAAAAGDRLWVGDALPVDQARVSAVREKIDPNAAPAASLRRLHQVGPARAAAIVQYRQSHGPRPFVFAEDLDKVRGIGPGLLQQFQDQLSLPTRQAGREGSGP